MSRWTGKEEWQWGTQTIIVSGQTVYEPILTYNDETGVLRGDITHEFGTMSMNKKVTNARHLELAMELASVVMSGIGLEKYRPVLPGSK
jgi:hypothetical protein